MAEQLEPVLAQFAIRPECEPDLSDLTPDPESGLLHAGNSASPVIDEMLVDPELGRNVYCVVSVLTRVRDDPVDPDLVRTAPRDTCELDAFVERTVTKSTTDPVEPDFLRTSSLIRLLETDLQKVAPDPDLIRPLPAQRVYEGP